MGHHAQAVEQMARHHLIRVTHGGQVVGLVPFDQQGEVGEQLLLLLRRQFDSELLRATGQFVGVALGDEGHQRVCSS
ncbi:hypothetical protein D9M72_627580 [compost metagenome]